MNLNVFLHQLQFEPDKVKSKDWETDWADAPLPYKLYRGLPSFPLCAEVPLTLAGERQLAKPNLRELGHFLWYTFGLARLSQSVFGSDAEDDWGSSLQLCRRFVPSGGGLYPSELYLYLKLEELPLGVYHYDVAHHRLILLREGNYDDYLSKALGNRCDLTAAFGVAFVSTMFWKNYFKYNQFSYRLQGLDAGLLIGQLLAMAKSFGFETGVCYQFLDRAVNRLLGLSELEESAYAVIPLSNELGILSSETKGDVVVAANLCEELEELKQEHFIRSQRVLEFPMLLKLNEASMLDSTVSFQPITMKKQDTNHSTEYKLPNVARLSYDMAAVLQERYSPENEFVLQQVSQSNLAALLNETLLSFEYRNDLDGNESLPASRIGLYSSLYGVEGIPNGAYRYDGSAHTLQLLREGDHRGWLQNGMSLDNVSLHQVPLCFHIAGDLNFNQALLDYRGYRIQQMEAGVLVHRLLLAASASRMGGRPLLGFDVKVSDELYGIASRGLTSLIQIPIGYCRTRSRLEGSLAH